MILSPSVENRKVALVARKRALEMITSADWMREASQWTRMAAAVPRWLSGVPLYQNPGRAGCPPRLPEFLRCFRQLPFITKEDIRQGFPRNFLPQGVELGQLLDDELVELERTSGTSEEPTPLLLGRGWWNRQEASALRLNHWVAKTLSPGARRVSILSPFCTSEINYSGVPACSERILGESLFVNLSRHPFAWSEAALERMVQETLDWAPLFLDVDPVYGTLFALYCERQRVSLPSVRFVLTSYEYASVRHREILQRVFGVPVVNLFGSTETGHLLMEDDAGVMVPSLETAFLEMANVDAADIGEMIVTTLGNEFMPLIRYRIGDLVRCKPEASGNTYELHGRLKDALISARGERVTVRQVDACLEGLGGVLHYRLRQDSPVDYQYYYVVDEASASASDLATLVQRLASLLGTQQGFSAKQVHYLPCESSGKFRLCSNETVA